MKKLIILALILLGIFFYFDRNPGTRFSSLLSKKNTSNDIIKEAFDKRLSDFEVIGRGKIIHLLRDDNKGNRHQRFILQLTSGQKVLIAHNIDLASRVKSIKPGDTIEFKGEYEWNPKGGIIHRTHEDLSGRHNNGWLKYRGQIYQ